MSILVYIEQNEGKIRKSSFEAAWYASELAVGKPLYAVTIGEANEETIAAVSEYGIKKIYNIKRSDPFDVCIYSDLISQVAKKVSAEWVIISNTYNGKSLTPYIAGTITASAISGVISLPELNDSLPVVKKSCYSGKGFAHVEILSKRKILAITPNSFNIFKKPVDSEIEFYQSNSELSSGIRFIESNKITGKIPLTEAEIVVSGGRGMKGPENWGMIEQLADILEAATACSKPVADMHWRPHEEHVGQTGITIKPNLYIAAGISGAIQHLAGVSSSKVIVAINKDPEAPLFKVADYGIIGDIFEVLPQIIEAAKIHKGKILKNILDQPRIKLSVKGLTHGQTQGTYTLVLGEETGKRKLAIIIGQFEAQAIAVQLEKMTPFRPMTHDLFVILTRNFYIDVKEVVIYNLIEGVFYSRLVCIQNDYIAELDCRTSDAISLALRYNCPIFTTEKIMEIAGLDIDFETSTQSEEESQETDTKTEPESIEIEPDNLSIKSWDELQILLDEALKNEDYSKAADIRDEMNKRK